MPLVRRDLVVVCKTGLRTRSRTRAGALLQPPEADRLELVPQQLHDQAQLLLAQQRLNPAHDPWLTADHQPITDLKRQLPRQMTRRDNLIPTPQLVPILDPGHRPNSLRSLHDVAACYLTRSRDN
jgi:hypothetical protein